MRTRERLSHQWLCKSLYQNLWLRFCFHSYIYLKDAPVLPCPAFFVLHDSASLNINTEPQVIVKRSPQVKKIMEGSSSSTDGSHNPSEKARASEFEKARKQYEEKMVRIQELKKQIESVKVSLEEKKKNIPVPEETKEAFESLSQRYESLREEYNGLLAQKSKDHK